MKNLVISILVLFSFVTMAVPSPYTKETWAMKKEIVSLQANDTAEGAALDVVEGYLDYDSEGLLSKRVARAVYDAAVDGGVSGASYSLGVVLPAKSIVIKSFYNVASPAVVAASGNTYALYCGNTALMTAINLHASADVVAAMNNDGGTAAEMDRLAAACTLNVRVGSGTTGITSGKVINFIEYVIGE